MKEFCGRYIEERVSINDPDAGIIIVCELSEGSGFTSEWPLVAHGGYVSAPGRGEEAVEELASELQRIANERQCSVVHLTCPRDNSRGGKLLFTKLAQAGLYTDIWFGERRYLYRIFEPLIDIST